MEEGAIRRRQLGYPSINALLKYSSIEKRKQMTKRIPTLREISKNVPFYFEDVTIRVDETRLSISTYVFDTKTCIYTLKHGGKEKEFQFFICPKGNKHRHEKRFCVLPSNWSLETMAECFTNFYFNRRNNVFRRLQFIQGMSPYYHLRLPLFSLFKVQMPTVQQFLFYSMDSCLNGVHVANINNFRADMTSVLVINSGGMHSLFGLTASHLTIEDMNSNAGTFVGHCNNFMSKQYAVGSYYKACNLPGLFDYIDFYRCVFDNLETATKAILVDVEQFNKIVKGNCKVLPFCIRVPINETTVLNIGYTDHSAIAVVMPENSSVSLPWLANRHHDKYMLAGIACLMIFFVLLIILNFIYEVKDILFPNHHLF